jgi:hypothetical protein
MRRKIGIQLHQTSQNQQVTSIEAVGFTYSIAADKFHYARDKLANSTKEN